MPVPIGSPDVDKSESQYLFQRVCKKHDVLYGGMTESNWEPLGRNNLTSKNDFEGASSLYDNTTALVKPSSRQTTSWIKNKGWQKESRNRHKNVKRREKKKHTQMHSIYCSWSMISHIWQGGQGYSISIMCRHVCVRVCVLGDFCFRGLRCGL